MGAAFRHFRDDVPPVDDLTGQPVPEWHESMKQWQAQRHEPVPMPDKVRAQLATIKAERPMRRVAHVSTSEAVWLEMNEATRAILVMLCTDRPSNTAGTVSWLDLTATEREAIAMQVRSFARECGRAMVTGLR